MSLMHDANMKIHVTVCLALRFRILGAVSLKSQVFHLGSSNQIKRLLEVLDSLR